jgi:hypothetical protein
VSTPITPATSTNYLWGLKADGTYVRDNDVVAMLSTTDYIGLDEQSFIGANHFFKGHVRLQTCARSAGKRVRQGGQVAGAATQWQRHCTHIHGVCDLQLPLLVSIPAHHSLKRPHTHHTHRRKHAGDIFGGVNVIMSGDLNQQGPIMDAHKHAIPILVADKPKRRKQAVTQLDRDRAAERERMHARDPLLEPINGREVLLKFNTVLMLKGQHRAHVSAHTPSS